MKRGVIWPAAGLRRRPDAAALAALAARLGRAHALAIPPTGRRGGWAEFSIGSLGERAVGMARLAWGWAAGPRRRPHSHLQTKDAASCDATASAHMLLALPADSLRVHACSLVITWTARRHSEATRSDPAAVAAFAPVTARESQTVRRAEQPRAQCIMVMHDSSVHAGNKPPAYLKFLSMHSSQLQLHQHLLLERLRSTTSAQ